MFSRKAQTTLEYAILIAIVAGAVLSMHSYTRRAIQARLKTTELDLNEERNK